MNPKPKRVVDRKFLDEHHKANCVVHRRPGCDPSHIQSRGARGDDVPENVLPLCNDCHRYQHQHGWLALSERHPEVAWELEARGWRLDERGRLRRA